MSLLISTTTKLLPVVKYLSGYEDYVDEVIQMYEEGEEDELEITNMSELYLTILAKSSSSILDKFNDEYNVEYCFVRAFEMYFPREYNFEVADCKIEYMANKSPLAIILDNNFLDEYKAWLKEEYSDRDGFYSLVPTDYQELDKEEEWKDCIPLEFLFSRLEFEFEDIIPDGLNETIYNYLEPVKKD